MTHKTVKPPNLTKRNYLTGYCTVLCLASGSPAVSGQRQTSARCAGPSTEAHAGGGRHLRAGREDQSRAGSGAALHFSRAR